MPFTLYEIDTAPEPAKAELTKSQQDFGFIPNLHKVLAAAPQALEAYKYLHGQFASTSFNNTEQCVVWQTINYFHQCHYCLPAHTGIAHMLKVDPAIIEALHRGEALSDSKLAALQSTTRALVEQRGILSDAQLAVFRDAGYGEQQLLEIVLGIAQKTLSNYANHLAQTPVDEPFQKFVE